MDIKYIAKIILILFALGAILVMIYFLKDELYDKFDIAKNMFSGLFKFS